MKVQNDQGVYMKFKRIMACILSSAVLMAAAGCGSSGDSSELSGKLSISGSSALFPLAKDGALKFKEKHPKVAIALNAGGSGTGLKQVYQGSVDIGNSDVEAVKKLPESKAKQLVDHKVCIMTIAVVVNKDVGAEVQNLTTETLQDIFTGKIRNWKEAGGPDEPIILVTRPSTSGTRALFNELALKGMEEIAGGSLETEDSGTLLQMITQSKGAVGYVSLPYIIHNRDVSILSIDGVAPTLENTYNGTYKVWGYEHMYTKGEPSGVVKAYLDFMLSDEYGKELEKAGYGVPSKMKF